MADIYDFRRNRAIRGVSAQAVGEELARIRAEQGELTAENVLSAAQDTSSPLHGAFEWDDTEAARQHRLDQARRLIVSIRVINSPVQTPVPVYVSVRTPEHGRTFMPTLEVLSDEQLKARALQEIRTFLESIERRYSHFREVADLLAGLKKTVG